MRAQAQTYSPANMGEMNIISFFSLFRYHRLFLIPHPQRDYIGKSVQMELGSERAGERRDGGSDSAEMKTGDYWSTGNAGWIFDTAFVMFPYQKTHNAFILVR